MNLNRKVPVFLMVAMALVLVTAVTYALTITVDGNEADWVATSAGTQIDPGGNEGTIPDAADIEYMRWTNDQTNMFFLVNTYGTPSRLNGASWVLVCLNTDGNTGTGSTTGFLYYDNCNQQTGFDRIVLLQSNFGSYAVGVGTVSDTDVITYPGQGTYGYTTNDVVEMSAPLTLLGFNAANCPAAIPAVLYYDGGDTSDDDHTPETGTININCGAPTAVTLQNVSASGQSAVLPFVLGAFGLIVVSTGLVINRKRKTVQ